jgi:hypothetical protein
MPVFYSNLLSPKLEDLVLRYKYKVLKFGESTMAIMDGFRLERICLGAQEKWRVSR